MPKDLWIYLDDVDGLNDKDLPEGSTRAGPGLRRNVNLAF